MDLRTVFGEWAEGQTIEITQGGEMGEQRYQARVEQYFQNEIGLVPVSGQPHFQLILVKEGDRFMLQLGFGSDRLGGRFLQGTPENGGLLVTGEMSLHIKSNEAPISGRVDFQRNSEMAALSQINTLGSEGLNVFFNLIGNNQ